MAERWDYRLGSIWVVTFAPSIGTEIRKTRPALVISGSVFNDRRSKVTVLPFTSAHANDPRLSPAVVKVSASTHNGLAKNSLLVCVEPMTFDKAHLTQYLGQLEQNLLEQTQLILKQYLNLGS
jgi:mRNA interferase MazF